MRKLFSLVGIGLCAVSTAFGQLVYSNNSTNFTVTVYGAGSTNNNTYLIITNQVVNLPIRIRAANTSTATVWCISALDSSSYPTVQTNPIAGQVKIDPGEVKVLQEWPVVDNKAWSAYTTNGFGSTLHIFIDKP